MTMKRSFLTSFCVVCLGACSLDNNLQSTGPSPLNINNCRADEAQDVFVDADGDGYGSTEAAGQSCEIPEGYSANSLDCDDTHPKIHGGNGDACGDEIDNDCDGVDTCAANLAARWTFAETSGTSTTDESGNQLTGLLVNNLVHNPAAGLAFDGQDDYVLVEDSDILRLAEGTISLWFKPTTIDNPQTMLSKDSDGNDAGGQFAISQDAGGVVRVKLQSNQQSYEIVSVTPVTAGQWNHVSFSFGGNAGMTVHVNDQEGIKDPYTGGLSLNPEPMVIGAGTDNSGDLTAEPISTPFLGTIANVQIYDRQLRRDEVSSLMATSNPQTPTP